jgi:hypothetical protein
MPTIEHTLISELTAAGLPLLGSRAALSPMS